MHTSLQQGARRLAAAIAPLRCLARPCSLPRRQRRNFWFRASAEGEEPTCLYQGFSDHNRVVTVLEVPENVVEHFKPFAGSRILLLDHSGNLHSVWRRDKELTGAYWDLLATLPSLVPPGPLALLGLGAGTVPRLIAANYPETVIHGWELDPGVVMAGRMFLGMQELEDSGALVTHVGDALADSATVPGGFSGIIVDLFADAALLPQLTKRSTWEDIRARLSPGVEGCRLIVNLGAAPPSVPGQPWQPDAYTTLRAYEALEAAFGGDVSVLSHESNILALTGPLPAASAWPLGLPEGLRHLGQAAWRRDVYPLQTSAVPLELF